MRKIIPQHVEEKNTRRKQFIAGGILILLMLLSTIAYAFQMIFSSSNASATNTITYNGFNFQQQNNFWILNLNVGKFIFSYKPSDMKKIPGIIDRLSEYNKTRLYVYSESPDAESEIRVNMAQFASSIDKACPEGTTCDANIPIKNCEENFIIIKSGVEKILQQKNCLFIEGKNEDLANIADEFLLKILGIDS